MTYQNNRTQNQSRPQQQRQGAPAASQQLVTVDAISQHLLQDDTLARLAEHCQTDLAGVRRVVQDIANVLRVASAKEDSAILKCSPESFVNCITDAHALRMRIDGRQHCYVVPVPIKNNGVITAWEAQVRPGYKGYVNRLHSGLKDCDIQCELIWPEDEFSTWSENGTACYKHRPAKEFRADVGNIVGVFCYISYWVGGEKKAVIAKLGQDDIKKIRGKATTQKIWDEWFSEKVKVACIRRACKVRFASLTDDLNERDNDDYDLESGGEAPSTTADRFKEKMSSAKYNPATEVVDATFEEVGQDVRGSAETVVQEPEDGGNQRSDAAEVATQQPEPQSEPTPEPFAKTPDWDGKVYEIEPEPSAEKPPMREVGKKFNNINTAYAHLVGMLSKLPAGEERKRLAWYNKTLSATLYRQHRDIYDSLVELINGTGDEAAPNDTAN